LNSFVFGEVGLETPSSEVVVPAGPWLAYGRGLGWNRQSAIFLDVYPGSRETVDISGRTGQLEGTLMLNGEPGSEATVMLVAERTAWALPGQAPEQRAKDEARTADQGGRFVFSEAASGIHDLFVHWKGIDQWTKHRVEVVAGETRTVSIDLAGRTVTLEFVRDGMLVENLLRVDVFPEGMVGKIIPRLVERRTIECFLPYAKAVAVFREPFSDHQGETQSPGYLTAVLGADQRDGSVPVSESAIVLDMSAAPPGWGVPALHLASVDGIDTESERGLLPILVRHEVEPGKFSYPCVPSGSELVFQGFSATGEFVEKKVSFAGSGDFRLTWNDLWGE
jgi:hypothetical protein